LVVFEPVGVTYLSISIIFFEDRLVYIVKAV
jgi:hypothetical protein